MISNKYKHTAQEYAGLQGTPTEGMVQGKKKTTSAPEKSDQRDKTINMTDS